MTITQGIACILAFAFLLYMVVELCWGGGKPSRRDGEDSTGMGGMS